MSVFVLTQVFYSFVSNIAFLYWFLSSILKMEVCLEIGNLCFCIWHILCFDIFCLKWRIFILKNIFSHILAFIGLYNSVVEKILSNRKCLFLFWHILWFGIFVSKDVSLYQRIFFVIFWLLSASTLVVKKFYCLKRRVAFHIVFLPLPYKWRFVQKI